MQRAARSARADEKTVLLGQYVPRIDTKRLGVSSKNRARPRRSPP